MKTTRIAACAALFGASTLLPRHSVRLIEARWRAAYALGFVRAAFGWHAASAARTLARRSIP